MSSCPLMGTVWRLMAAVDYKERGSRPNCSVWSSLLGFFFSFFKYILEGYIKTAARLSGQRTQATGLKDWIWMTYLLWLKKRLFLSLGLKEGGVEFWPSCFGIHNHVDIVKFGFQSFAVFTFFLKTYTFFFNLNLYQWLQQWHHRN